MKIEKASPFFHILYVTSFGQPAQPQIIALVKVTDITFPHILMFLVNKQ